jgi:hypothetical protein
MSCCAPNAYAPAAAVQGFLFYKTCQAWSTYCVSTAAAGTSSVLACALLRPLMAEAGMSLQQRQQLVKGLLGTHAHEMSSMAQQLLAAYDQEAGRRCGLNVSASRCAPEMRS